MSSSLVESLPAMRDAIVELVEGQIGLVRTVPHGAFKWADLIGAPPEEQQRITRNTAYGSNWFDLESRDERDSDTGFSAHNSRRTIDVDVEFLFVRYVQHRTTIVAGVRRDATFVMRGELDDVLQALSRPHNLDTTSDDRETRIVDGCLRAPLPVLGRNDRDWANHLLRISVTATFRVDVTQEV